VTDTERARWESDVVLADGGTVHVRPVRPDDRDRLVAFHGRLSPESIYYRYFSPKPRLSDKEVERAVNVDFRERVALIALLGEELVGMASFDRWRGHDEAEVAFTVQDAHHGRGIATVLLEHLAAIARDLGINRFTAEVLPDNRPMLAVFAGVGFDVTTRFVSGIVDVGFDLDPTMRFVESVERREQRAESRSIERLVRPRSIAVVGASDREGSLGRVVMRNLLARGFDGPVYPVNPTVPHVASVPAYAAVGDITDDIHLAVLAVPAAQVPDVLVACAAKRVRAMVVLAAGFADAGAEGAAAERALVEAARAHGMRLLGPASLGLVATTATGSMYASFAPVEVRHGSVAVAIQSGPLGIAVLELAHRLHVGLSTFVSLGNKGDVSANDFLNYWEDDPQTTVILMYTESFGNPRKFGRIARRVSRRKPIVAVRARHDEMDEEATDALFQQAGVIRVPSVRELFDVGRLLASQPMPEGPGVAVVSNAASPAVLAADALVAAGLQVSDEPLDLTYVAGPEDYRRALAAVLAGPADAALVVYAPPVVDRLDDVADAVTSAAAATTKPVVAVTIGRGDGPLGPGSRVQAFEFPERAAAALGRVVRYARWRHQSEEELPEFVDVDADAAAALVAHALEVRPTGTLLPLAVTASLLATHGIPFAPARAVTTVDAALAAAEDLGYPVALKAARLSRPLRSESGGVALDLQDGLGLRGAYERMAAAFGAGMAEAVVQRMVPGGVETIVAVEHHVAFGSVVRFGLGGAFADAIADHPVRSLPLTVRDATELVASSRAATALHSTGAGPASVVDLLVRVGALVDSVAAMTRLQLNPVIVSATGAVTVDATIHVAPSPPRPVVAPLRRLE
jgi:acyl-CoA synthetase (NDP forming)/RimJ/RimL family protein N-acetyltransferase